MKESSDHRPPQSKAAPAEQRSDLEPLGSYDCVHWLWPRGEAEIDCIHWLWPRQAVPAALVDGAANEGGTDV